MTYWPNLACHLFWGLLLLLFNRRYYYYNYNYCFSIFRFTAKLS